MATSDRLKALRHKPLRVLLAAGLLAGGALVAMPSAAQAADVGSNCDGTVNMGRSDVKVNNNLAITVNGITYGKVNVGTRIWIEDGMYHYIYKVAVKDSRSDGLAPYVKAFETVGSTTYTSSNRFINRRGSANGWVCSSVSGIYKLNRITFRGSVADAPSIPEPAVFTLIF